MTDDEEQTRAEYWCRCSWCAAWRAHNGIAIRPRPAAIEARIQAQVVRGRE